MFVSLLNSNLFSAWNFRRLELVILTTDLAKQ